MIMSHQYRLITLILSTYCRAGIVGDSYQLLAASVTPAACGMSMILPLNDI